MKRLLRHEGLRANEGAPHGIPGAARFSLSRYLGYQGFAVDDVRIEQGEGGSRCKILTLRDRRKTSVCPRCKKRRPKAFQEAEPIRLRETSIGDFVTWLEIRPFRIRCCHGAFVERLPFRAGGHRMSVRFFERIAALTHVMPVEEVARIFGLWDTVARVDMEATELALGGREPSIPDRLREIGIDEVSRTGGHVYFTVVTNLKTRRVIFLGDGKGEKGLLPFLDKIGPKGLRRIRVVVADLGYQNAIEKHFPRARYVLDRFHIVKWLNEALDKIRRRLFGGGPSDDTGRHFKVKKWLLLSGHENLEPRHQRELARLLQLNRPLYKAYLLKEQLREILHHPWQNLEALAKSLRRWCRHMSWSGERELLPVARRIRGSIDRIVARYEFPHLPMGLVEATNGIIAHLRRQARGYRKPEYFKLKIFQRCSLEHDPWRETIL